jgi:hypothetical protein
MARLPAAGDANPAPRRTWIKRVILAAAVVLLAVWMVILVRILLALLAGPA